MEVSIPQGFWLTVATVMMVIFIIFGIDLVLFKARIVSKVGRMLNKGFNVDKTLVRMLENLKSTSDHQYDVEPTLLNGPGRVVLGCALIVGALILFNLLSLLK